jgi:hypothetical protein
VDICQDYEELFRVLNDYKIKYMVVGAHAVIYYSEPRYTKDLDVWIPPSLNDPEAVYEALAEFGGPLKGLSPNDFTDKKMILQIGVVPVRVGVLIDIRGVSPEKAWKNRKKTRYGRTWIHVLGMKELIQSKRKAGRSQDKLDIEILLDRSKRGQK